MKKKLLMLGITGLSFLVSTKGFSQAPVADFTISQPTTCVGTVVQLTDNSSNTPTSWSYTVESMTGTLTAQNPTLNFSLSGDYDVTLVATNASGSSSPITKTITVNPLPTVVITQPTVALCSGESTTLSATGGTSYVWSNAVANGGTFVPSATANFTVTVTDANNCVNTGVKNVTVNPVPVLNVSGTNSICVGTPVTETVTGADTYLWSTGVSTDNIVENPTSTTLYTVTGTYTLTGCSTTAAKTVSVDAIPTLTVADASICAGDVFTLVATGAANYAYSSGSNTVMPSSNTSYTVSGSSPLGCAAASDAVINVTVNPLPTLSVTGGTICAGSNFTLMPSGAATYTYSGGSNVVSPSSSQSYTITGKDVNGCAAAVAAVADITVSPVPSLTVAGTSSICVGAAAVTETVTGGADTYSWSTGAVIDNITDTPTMTTVYTVIGTYTLTGCSSTAAKTVSVDAYPSVTVTSGAVCAGNVFTISASGAASYVYSNGSNTVIPTANDSYTVTGSSPLGCSDASGIAVASVTVNALPTLTVNGGAICAGNSFTITPSGASSYAYQGGSNVVSPAASQVFTVTGTDANGCVSAAAAVNITVNAVPVLTVNSGAICAGASFTINANGASTYVYQGGSNVVSPTSTQNYTVVGTDANGCNSSAAVSAVTVNALPTITVNSGAICAGASFTINPSGASTYVYSNGSNVVTPSANQSYTVTGTDANGCTSASGAVATVTVNALPVITVNSGAICMGASFTLNPSGASTYVYSSGSNVVTPSANQSYTVTGTDANGCTSATGAVSTVTVNTLPVITVNSGAICMGASFTMTPGGASTYVYSSGSNVVTPSANQSYTVTGTDANGCTSATGAVSTVTVNALPVITVNSGAICAGNVFTITASGASTYAYAGGSNTVAPTSTQSYTVTGTDANGCVSAAVSSTITVNALPNVAVSLLSPTICAGETTTITSSGAANYSWNSGENTAAIVVTLNSSTSYTVTGTDANGCSSRVVATQEVSACDGIAERANAIEAGVYPNPNNGMFVVNVSQPTSVTIINSVGQTVYASELSNGENTVSLNDQTTGIYFVQLKQGAQVKTIRVIRN